MNDDEKWSSQCRITGPVSRAGSVVTKTTWTLLRSAASSWSMAEASVAMVVGHSSGQCV
jgi:hypothetical protein